MRAKTVLVLTTLVALLAVATATGAQETDTVTDDVGDGPEVADAPAPEATAAVQVTKDPRPDRAYATPQIAVHPETEELAIADTEFRTSMTCNVHVSSDGGRSWLAGGDPMQEPYTDCGGDPLSSNNHDITFGPDGTLYVAFPAHDPEEFGDRERGEYPRHVFLARSDDSGRSFDTTMVFEAPEELDEEDGSNTNRRVRVVADPTDPSRVYVGWQQAGDEDEANKAVVAASGDGGESFDEPQQLSDERGAYHPRLAVDGEGTVHAVLPTLGFAGPDEDPLRRAVDYRRSTDGGETWSEADELDEGHEGFTFGRKWELTAEPDSTTLYAVWYGNEDREAERPEDDRNVFLRASPDGGDTWNDPVLVNDDMDEVQHYDPGIDVAPNGRVDIAWLDFRNSPYPEQDAEGPPFNHGGFQDVYHSFSTDEGETLSDNARITDRIINREIGVWSNNVHIHGHTGVASTDDTVYFAWQDTRNGDAENQAEDTYFASYRIQEAEPAGATGGAEGLPTWLVAVTALLVGLGLAMLVSGLLVRRVFAARG